MTHGVVPSLFSRLHSIPDRASQLAENLHISHKNAVLAPFFAPSPLRKRSVFGIINTCYLIERRSVLMHHDAVQIPWQPVKTRRASEEIYLQLREFILSGQLKPGDRLPSERAMMAQLNRSPPDHPRGAAYARAGRLHRLNAWRTRRRGTGAEPARRGGAAGRDDPVQSDFAAGAG